MKQIYKLLNKDKINIACIKIKFSKFWLTKKQFEKYLPSVRKGDIIYEKEIIILK